VLCANRDEYFDRPSDLLDWWDDDPSVLAGRDRLAGGTWLGVTSGGRVAAITNFRAPRQHRHGLPSRGGLVAEFLRGQAAAEAFREKLKKESAAYNGFNLLFGDGKGLHYFSNRGGSSGPIVAGIHGLSNHLLDTPWPKVETAKARLAGLLTNDTLDAEELADILADCHPFPDEELPDTGVGLERERFLSPLFIKGEGYGTCSTSVVLVERGGCLTFLERRHDHGGGSGISRLFTIALSRQG
jgi:uncharacterized protein with NRDE domain